MDGVAHLRREAPIHALMLGVMGLAMLSHSALATVGGAALLVAVSVPCAALSRARPFLRAHLLDLWAMALVLLALLPQHPARGGHHALAVLPWWAFAAVVVAWAGARLWLGMRGSGGGGARAAAASGGLTAAGLATMAVFCAV